MYVSSVNHFITENNEVPEIFELFRKKNADLIIDW